MNEYSPFQEAQQEPAIRKFELGDALADDQNLKDFLRQLAQNTNEDAPKTRPSHTQELLAFVSKPLRFTIGKVVSSYAWIRDRFTNHVIRQATAKKIESEASLNHSTAATNEKETNAKTEVLLAQAESIRTETQITKIKFLEKMGIDWQAEYDEDGHVNIVFSKKPRIENDDTD